MWLVWSTLLRYVHVLRTYIDEGFLVFSFDSNILIQPVGLIVLVIPYSVLRYNYLSTMQLPCECTEYMYVVMLS